MRWLALLALVACGGTPAGSGGDDDPRSDASPGGGSGDGGTTDAPPGVRGVFDPAVTEVVIEIDYEQGHEPYTGAMVGGDTFDLSATNLDRLFAGKKTLTLPRVTAAMQNIGAVPDEQLTIADLLALAATHRSAQDTATRKTYYVLFVSGAYADDNGPNPNVLGISLGGTGVIAMFKDTVRGTSVLPSVVRYVEQSTLIHEIAHAVGLVDNGVAMAAPHRDATHGPHCNNNRCVMYWLNEGANDAAQFVQQNVLTGNTIVFDAACLADVDALTGGL